MTLFSWLSKKEPEDYEQVLSSLALDIQKRQTRLSEIRLRERRTTLLLTIYAFAVWVVYAGAWYAGLLPHVSGLQFESTLKAVPVFIGPIVIQFSRRIVQTWYARIGTAEEKTLKNLLGQQRSKVEEIKKKTNYYTTKNLLDRYDATPAESPVRPRPGAPQAGPGTPQRPIRGTMSSQPQTPKPRVPGQGVADIPNARQLMTPPRKQWYDKLADALLGDDELGSGGAASRYALICQKCFAHNGLVKEEQWEDAQYVCPKCGHFNPSVRSQKAGKAASPPTSPDAVAQVQRRKTGPRKSEPAGQGNVAAATGADRRKSLPAPELPDAMDDVEERPPVPPLPAQFAQRDIANTSLMSEDDSDAVGNTEPHSRRLSSEDRQQSEEMEIDH